MRSRGRPSEGFRPAQPTTACAVRFLGGNGLVWASGFGSVPAGNVE